MVELKCRAELAVTGRSACRNAECEHSKERGGRIPQGKLRWGIGGPGGHSMKWYCIRPACLPYDQVKDMLKPEKCENAAEMEGVPELPPGFREATIAFLEAIRDDKTDQLDPAHRAKLDEVGPMLPVPPRAPVAARAESIPAPVGRQGLRRVKRSFKGGASSVEDDNASDDDRYSGEDDHRSAMGMGMGMGHRGGGMGGGGSASSSPSSLSRTVSPPALLIPRRTDSGHGGSDSPVLPPPMKMPRLDESIGGGLVGVGALTGGLSGVLGVGGELGVGGGLAIGGGLDVGAEGLGIGGGGLTGELGSGAGLGLGASGLDIGSGSGGGDLLGDGSTVGSAAAADAAATVEAVPSSSSSTVHPQSLAAAAAGGGGGAERAGLLSPGSSAGTSGESYHAFGDLSLYPSGTELSPSGGASATTPPSSVPLSPVPLGTAGAAGASGTAMAEAAAATASGVVTTAGIEEVKSHPLTFVFDGGVGDALVEPKVPATTTAEAGSSAAATAPTSASLPVSLSLGIGGSEAGAGAGAGAGESGFPQGTGSIFSTGSGSAQHQHQQRQHQPHHAIMTASSAEANSMAGAPPLSLSSLSSLSSSSSTLVPPAAGGLGFPSVGRLGDFAPSAAALRSSSAAMGGDAVSSFSTTSPGLATLGGNGTSGGRSTDTIVSSLLGGTRNVTDPVASALEGIGDDYVMGGGSVPSVGVPAVATSTGFGEVGSSSSPDVISMEGGLSTAPTPDPSSTAISGGGDGSSTAPGPTTPVPPPNSEGGGWNAGGGPPPPA